MKATIRLSQCMIVKNEEKNIRRALEWGKKVVCEQIVVDTGSTDRTVEIAEQMGAKVFRFPWINDFSAAKNFAIEKAGGTWIAFLDADEYFSKEDAKKIFPILKKLEDNISHDKMPHIVRSSLVNLNEAGEPFTVGVQDRIFRNTPQLRFKNRIHEVLYRMDGMKPLICDASKELCVYHTGYTKQAFTDADKAQRNIALLKQELEGNPDDYNLWSYYGDSLIVGEMWEEAEMAYRKVVDNLNSQITEGRRNKAFCNLLKIMYYNNENEDRMLEVYNKTLDFKEIYPDAEYWIGASYFKQGEDEKGIFYYEAALKKLEKSQKSDVSLILSNIYQRLLYTFSKMNKAAVAIRYGVLALRLNRYTDGVLQEMLILFKKESKEEKSTREILEFLRKLYDFNSLRDKLFIIKASKLAGYTALETLIYELLSEDERSILRKKKKSPYRVSKEERERDYPNIASKNETDEEFLALIKEVRERTIQELQEQLKERISNLNKKQPDIIDKYELDFSRYPSWKELITRKGKWEGVEERVSFVKDKYEDVLWLYSNLSDYHSKKVLLSILKNWLLLDFDCLKSVQRVMSEYYDLDLIESAESSIFVDAGAYQGETARRFINTYGENYKRIFCYEPCDRATETLKRNLAGYNDIDVRHSALDCKKGTASIHTAEEYEEISWLSEEQGGSSVDTTTLDEDVNEKIDILKIDVCGSEKRVLSGAARHISEDRPKMMVALHYDCRDLTEIPHMIDAMYPGCRFYLRYYGESLNAANYMLYVI